MISLSKLHFNCTCHAARSYYFIVLLASMTLKHFCLLLGLGIFILFVTWDFRLNSLLAEIARLPRTEKVNTTDGIAQISHNSTPSPKPRILCWIPTGPKHHMSRSIHVKRTWGSRCDKLLFMSSAEDPRLGTVALQGVEEGHGKLWPKTQKAFQYVWEHHRNDADWFMKADDDTYVFVDNLRKFLNDYDPNDPHYFGARARFYDDSSKINFGGTGYVLSKEALRRFVQVALVDGGDCFTGIRPDYKGDEDTEIGICLRSVGVLPERTRDELGKARFWMGNPLKPFDDVSQDYEKFWKNGPIRISNRAISFHAVKPKHLYIYEYLTHLLKTDY